MTAKKKIKISTITEKPPFILVTRKLPSYFYSVLTETQVSAFLLQEYRKRHGNRIIIIICLIKAIALYAGFYNSVIVAGDDLQGCKGGPAHLLYNLAPPAAVVQCSVFVFLYLFVASFCNTLITFSH